MADRRVEEFAFAHGLSNRQAKKQMHSAAHRRRKTSVTQRGAPIAGTGKPKGAEKG